MSTAVTPYQASRSMDRARHHQHEHAAAYDAGYHGVPWDEHRDHRADPGDPHQRSLHAAHEQGRLDRMLEGKPDVPADVAARLRHREERSRTARATTAKAGGYIRRAGRSVTSRAGDIPTPSGGGTFVGIVVGMLALVLLFVALNHAGAVASLFTGLTSAAQWLIAPKPLPI